MKTLANETWLVRYWRAHETPPGRENLRRALIWGVCHVHTPVDQAEHEFDTYIQTGALPDGTMLPDMKNRAIVSIHEYVDGLDYESFVLQSTEDMIEHVVSNVYGLGPVKATFALTSVGLIDVACLDTHMIDQRLIPNLPGEWTKNRVVGYWNTSNKSVKTGVRRYLEMVERAYGVVDGSGILQWADYAETVDAFAESGHEVFFNAIGIA